MAQIFRQFLIATALLFAATFCLLKLSDIVLCGGLFTTCPGTPQWLFVEWVGEHQVAALGVVGAYVVALFALFRRDLPQAAAESIKPHFFVRALAFMAVICIVLVLATHFPRLAALLEWGA